MYCKNCGKPLGGDEKFCSNCGVKVEYDTDVKPANDIHNVEKKCGTKNEMVWDLGDFENNEKKDNSKLSWNTDGLFMEQKADQDNNINADYKGPLMFRTDEKAPSREEIEQREKEEETTKKSSLYADDGGLGKGNRWDISKVEIPKTYDMESKDNSGFNWTLDEDDMGVNVKDKKANGFKSIGQLNAQAETQNENQSKEELQAVIDGAIEKAEHEYENSDYGKVKESRKSTEKVEKERIQPSEFSWNLGDDEEDEFPPIIASPKNPLEIQLKINQPDSIEMKYDDMESHKAEPSEIDFNKEMSTTEPGWKNVPDEGRPMTSPKKQSDVIFDWSKEVDLPDYHPGVKAGPKGESEIDNVIDDVIDNNMSMTLEELAAGNVDSDRIPESNYDESRKTIRNVLSKNAKMQEPNFETSQLNSETLEKDLLEKEKEIFFGEEGTTESRVVGVEQPKVSNISLEICEDEDTGEKVEKVLIDDLKAPTECIKNSGFVHKEINDDIRVAQVDENSIMGEVMSSAVDVLINPRTTKLKNDKEKFYTFNKNKEEFQKLLEQEYKRLEGNDGQSKGFEEDIESFMDIHRGKNVEATSQIEEMNKARNVFINRPSYEGISVYEEDDFKDGNVQFDMDDLDKMAEAEGLEKIEGAQVIGNLDSSEQAAKENEDMLEESNEKLNENFDRADDEVASEDNVVEQDEVEPVVVVFEPQNEESLVETFIENEQAKGKALEEEPLKEENAAKKSKREKKHDKKAENVQDAKPESIDNSEKDKSVYDHGGVGKMIIDPSMNSETEKLASEFFDEEEEHQRKGGIKSVLLGILGVICVLIIAVLGIMIILPDSPVAKVMTDMGKKVVVTVTDIFGGDENKVENKVAVRESAMEDKTKLIQAEVDRNYKNNIEEIVYDSQLGYMSDVKYNLEDLKDVKDIQTILWYKDENGKPHYYDQEIVGTIIEFISMRSAWVNKDDKSIFSILNTGTKEYNKVESLEKNDKEKLVELLSIGDIKVAGNAYYIWTAETIDGVITERVYEIKEQNQKLYVNDHCDI